MPPPLKQERNRFASVNFNRSLCRCVCIYSTTNFRHRRGSGEVAFLTDFADKTYNAGNAQSGTTACDGGQCSRISQGLKERLACPYKWN